MDLNEIFDMTRGHVPDIDKYSDMRLFNRDFGIWCTAHYLEIKKLFEEKDGNK